jgi:hypothetical protein
MRTIIAKLRPWVVGAAIVGVTLGLGYYLAVLNRMDARIIFPALILGFVICDRIFWPPQSR